MATYGGKRPGAGKPKGSKSTRTIERDEALRQFRQTVQNATQHLIQRQMGLAVGSQYLYKIKKGEQEPIRVTADWELEAFLRGDFEDPKESNYTYYFLTTKDPDNRALDSLFNRTYGKATDNLDVTSGGQPINIDISEVIANKNRLK